MNNMVKCSLSEIQNNLADLIAKDWMLISAGDSTKFNTMTASWGYFGFYANKYSAVVFIRPERYTMEFVDKCDMLTLTFLPEELHDAHKILGTKSGRDGDKVAESGLTPIFTDAGNPTFQEAKIVVECRKLYKAPLDADKFIDKNLMEMWYNPKKGGMHHMLILEIVDVWVKK